MEQDQNPRNTTVLLLSNPRCASHVLERMLSKQPNMAFGSMWFLTARLVQRELMKAGRIEQTDLSLREELMTLENESFSKFWKFLLDAQQEGKLALAHVQPHTIFSPQVTSDYMHGSKFGNPGPFMVGRPQTDHEPHTNPTVLPDSVLLRPGTVPIINFRHPMLLCDGIYRGFRDLSAYHDTEWKTMTRVGASFFRSRLIYDWYVEHGRPVGIEPILVETDDYLGAQKESLMEQICARVPGFDAKSVTYEWPKATDEEIAAMPVAHAEAFKTINSSTGIMAGYDTQGRTIESETARWEEKYGKEDAEFIRGLVDKAMPDYEYLRQHRLRPDGTSSS